MVGPRTRDWPAPQEAPNLHLLPPQNLPHQKGGHGAAELLLLTTRPMLRVWFFPNINRLSSSLDARHGSCS